MKEKSANTYTLSVGGGGGHVQYLYQRFFYIYQNGLHPYYDIMKMPYT
jgi:hypothetical protein